MVDHSTLDIVGNLKNPPIRIACAFHVYPVVFRIQCTVQKFLFAADFLFEDLVIATERYAF